MSGAPSKILSHVNAILLAAVYFAAAAAALHLTQGASGIAAIWPASGIMLAGLLLLDKHAHITLYASVFVASMAANLSIGSTLWLATAFSVANLVEASVAHHLIGRFSKPDKSIASPYNLTIGALTAVAAAIVSASVAALLSGLVSAEFIISWATTVFFGMATIAPPILFIAKDWSRLQPAEKAAILPHFVAIAALSSVAFWQSDVPLLWLPMAALGYSTYRLGLTGSALGLLTIAATGSFHSAAGFGVMNASETTITSTMLLQVYLLGLLLSTLPIASLLERHDANVLALDAARNLAEDRAIEARRLAETDALTGIANRGKVMGDLTKLLTEARKHGSPLTIMMIDVDHFKSINDSFGHAAGDKALMTIAAIGDQLAGERGCFGRIGGEEFLMVLPNNNAASTITIAERFQDTVHGYDWKGMGLDQITLSIGVAGRSMGQDEKSLLSAADQALYEAKSDGRNRTRQAA